MTLKLISDNTVELPVGNLMDIAGMARRFADQMDNGEHGDVFRAVLVLQRDDGMVQFGWGENASPMEMMGLFEAAKLQVFADHMTDDEE